MVYEINSKKIRKYIYIYIFKKIKNELFNVIFMCEKENVFICFKWYVFIFIVLCTTQVSNLAKFVNAINSHLEQKINYKKCKH